MNDPCSCKFTNHSSGTAAAIDCGPDGKHFRSIYIAGQCCTDGHARNFAHINQSCMMRGPLPSSVGNLTMLTDLRLNNNNLQGTIPSELANLKLLTGLDLDSNNLSGIVPPLPF